MSKLRVGKNKERYTEHCVSANVSFNYNIHWLTRAEESVIFFYNKIKRGKEEKKEKEKKNDLVVPSKFVQLDFSFDYTLYEENCGLEWKN